MQTNFCAGIFFFSFLFMTEAFGQLNNISTLKNLSQREILSSKEAPDNIYESFQVSSNDFQINYITFKQYQSSDTFIEIKNRTSNILSFKFDPGLVPSTIIINFEDANFDTLFINDIELEAVNLKRCSIEKLEIQEIKCNNLIIEDCKILTQWTIDPSKTNFEYILSKNDWGDTARVSKSYNILNLLNVDNSVFTNNKFNYLFKITGDVEQENKWESLQNDFSSLSISVMENSPFEIPIKKFEGGKIVNFLRVIEKKKSKVNNQRNQNIVDEYSNIIFENVQILGKVQLLNLFASNLIFNNCELQGSIEIFPKNDKKCTAFFDEMPVDKIDFDAQNLELIGFFWDDSEKSAEIQSDQLEAQIYRFLKYATENNLSHQKKHLDLQLKKAIYLKREKSGTWGWLKYNWYKFTWNFGYAKYRVILITLGFFLLFIFINYKNLDELMNNVYCPEILKDQYEAIIVSQRNEELPSQQSDTEHIPPPKKTKLSFSIYYTIIIFFGLTLNSDDFKYYSLPKTIYIYIIHVVGIVCIAFNLKHILGL